MMIIASAIKFFYAEDKEHRFPQIWTGFRHADIHERMFKMGVKYDRNHLTEGFMTRDDTFMDRYEAQYYAYECGQISEEIYLAESCLYSEDIWPEEL